jgi:hypothetical protein
MRHSNGIEWLLTFDPVHVTWACDSRLSTAVVNPSNTASKDTQPSATQVKLVSIANQPKKNLPLAQEVPERFVDFLEK